MRLRPCERNGLLKGCVMRIKITVSGSHNFTFFLLVRKIRAQVKRKKRDEEMNLISGEAVCVRRKNGMERWIFLPRWVGRKRRKKHIWPGSRIKKR